MTQRIAIYGGTFDPIHNGHLGSIAELQTKLAIDMVHIVPSFIPPHRDAPGASAEQRIEMLQLAVQSMTGVVVDSREIERQGTSFTIDTLAGIRAEYGEAVELLFVMGADAFALLHTWHRWQELIDFAHVVVMARPHLKTEQPATRVLEWCNKRRIVSPAELCGAAGKIIQVELKPWNVSATTIRDMVQRHASVEPLVPKVVANYITEHKLYL